MPTTITGHQFVLKLLLFHLKRFDINDHIVQVFLSGWIMIRIDHFKSRSPDGHIVRAMGNDAPAELQQRGNIPDGYLPSWRLERVVRSEGGGFSAKAAGPSPLPPVP